MTFCPARQIRRLRGPRVSARETLRPYLDHIVESFGPDRLSWGSDWPVVNLGGGLPDWIAITRQFLEGWPDTDMVKLAHGNAVSTYKVATIKNPTLNP